MSSPRVTLKDIALACGYSANTVSRALRDDAMLSESTREPIRETAKKMGYIPNTMASSLRSGRSRMIAVIVNDLHNQHYCDLINRMDAALRRENYTLMILCMQLDDSLAEKLIHAAISLSVDGILYFPCFGQQHYVEYMINNRVPFLLLDRRLDDVEAWSATTMSRAAISRGGIWRSWGTDASSSSPAWRGAARRWTGWEASCARSTTAGSRGRTCGSSPARMWRTRPPEAVSGSLSSLWTIPRSSPSVTG